MKKIECFHSLNRTCLLICAIFLFLLTSCHPEDTVSYENALCINFEVEVDGDSLMFDTLAYVNAAGNRYEVNEIKYFISKVRLVRDDGSEVLITDDQSIHYVDFAFPRTLSWSVREALPAGHYNAVSFIFGLSKNDNQSHRFTNPPENNMSWPERLGGGYHYMQINGKWQSGSTIKPFNFHTGIGQIYDTLGQVTEYVHNDFEVIIRNLDYEISEKQTTLSLIMNVNQWFTSPHIYDFEVIGGSIMQNQQAQEIIKENGRDVFVIK